MFKMLSRLSIIMLVFLSSCSTNKFASGINMDEIAESYVKLVLKVGLYDPDYVDAYYGPEEWKPSKLESDEQGAFPYRQLNAEVGGLIEQLGKISQNEFSPLEKLRYAYLETQLFSVKARIDLLSGKRMSFDEESEALYDAVAPVHDEEYFEDILKKLDNVLPGEGDISERFNNYRKEFIIPKDKLDAAFKAAIAECRRRTLKYIELPENENFITEYVTDKPWRAYNWYKGNSFSLIEVNTDLPMYIDDVIGLACHEGYPGHHVYLTLLERHLVRDRNWMEFSVFPLFSPLALIAEGSANYGIDLAFDDANRIEFEREVLFPLAGLDPSKTEKYYNIIKLRKELRYAGNEAARQYLDGKMSKDEAIKWLTKYVLITPEEAAHIVRFIEKYRSYVINYNLGQDMVKDYIEKRGGTENYPDKCWELFYKLLSTPRTPSGLAK